MKLLFIGNSHTYYNSLPDIVRRIFEAMGQKTHVTMLTEGGKSLAWHLSTPNVPFNIRCGKYDVVIAQERAGGFEAVPMKEAAKALKDLTDKAGSQFLLYMPWAAKDNRAAQRAMTETYQTFCRAEGCRFAPAGEVYTRLLLTEAPESLYREDGIHATPLGSYAAALTIFYTLTGRKRIIDVKTIKDPGIQMGFSAELCQKLHTEACHMARLYNC